MDWAVNAYIDWCSDRLQNFQYNAPIYFADITNLATLQKDNFNHSLCRFMPEVTRKCGEGSFPRATLYQMIVAIQRYLVINKLKWKLLDDEEFEDMRIVLDNVMQEHTAQNIGVVKRHHSLCRFMPEVTRKCGEGSFPRATLYQMIIAIQRYLVINKLKWKLLDDEEFEDMRIVLDNVMQEHTAQNIGVVKRQAGIITYEHENSLWECGILGEDTPDKLSGTVLL